MTSPDYYVLDGDPGASIEPRRPTLADVGGAAFVDDQAYPPDPTTMPSAAMENQNEKLIQGFGKVVPIAILSIKFAAGTPGIDRMTALGSLLEAAHFTIAKLGVGYTRISWAANKLPPSVAPATLGGLHSDGDFRGVAIPGTNQVEIKTRDSAGALADCDYSLHIY